MAIGCWSIKRGIAVNSIGHSLIKYSFLIFWLISSQLILKICCLFLSYRDFISLKFYVLKQRNYYIGQFLSDSGEKEMKY